MELTLFNFRYYTNKIYSLDKQTIKVDKKEIIDDQENERNKIVKEYTIELDETVKGIKLNISQENENSITIKTSFLDQEAQYLLKKLNEKTYNPNYTNSDYIVLNSEGHCKLIKIRAASNSEFKLDSIDINTWYFEFNILRVIILLSITTIILYRKEINNAFKSEKRKKYFYIFFISIMMIIYIIYAMGYGQKYERRDIDNKVFSDPYI